MKLILIKHVNNNVGEYVTQQNDLLDKKLKSLSWLVTMEQWKENVVLYGSRQWPQFIVAVGITFMVETDFSSKWITVAIYIWLHNGIIMARSGKQ
jgi:hypothetical protein